MILDILDISPFASSAVQEYYSRPAREIRAAQAFPSRSFNLSAAETAAVFRMYPGQGGENPSRSSSVSS